MRFSGKVLFSPCLDNFLKDMIFPGGHNLKGAVWNSRDCADAKCAFRILKPDLIVDCIMFKYAVCTSGTTSHDLVSRKNLLLSYSNIEFYRCTVHSDKCSVH